MNFYTYAYLREDKTPYYIGKGQGRRLYKKRKGEIKPPKDKSRIIFLKQNLTEEEAFRHEVYMISVFGRKDLGTGILHNRTNGGEGSSGLVHTEETRKKMSEARKKMGSILSEEGKERIRISALNNKKNSIGIFNQTPEEWSENCRKNGLRTKEKGVGIFSLSSAQLSENSKKSNSQKWMCLETGFITNSGPLSRYQIKRGIDTSKRIRIV
jgi:hypothetical protein